MCFYSHIAILFQSRKYMLNQEATRHLLICFVWVIKNVDQCVLKQWWSEMPIDRLNQLLEVLYYAVANFEYKVRLPTIPYTCLICLKVCQKFHSGSLDLANQTNCMCLGNIYVLAEGH